MYFTVQYFTFTGINPWSPDGMFMVHKMAITSPIFVF